MEFLGGLHGDFFSGCFRRRNRLLVQEGITFKELSNPIKDIKIFLLLLPLAIIDNQDKDNAIEIISNVLQEIFDKHLCSQYADCIVNGLMSE